jgi:hypothetical protein
MTAGLFALSGVLLGALMVAASARYFERRKERRSLRVGARLVREDVVQAGSSLETLLRRGWFEGIPLDVVAGKSTDQSWLARFQRKNGTTSRARSLI